jgi:hypothetical protein
VNDIQIPNLPGLPGNSRFLSNVPSSLLDSNRSEFLISLIADDLVFHGPEIDLMANCVVSGGDASAVVIQRDGKLYCQIHLPPPSHHLSQFSPPPESLLLTVSVFSSQNSQNTSPLLTKSFDIPYTSGFSVSEPSLSLSPFCLSRHAHVFSSRVISASAQHPDLVRVERVEDLIWSGVSFFSVSVVESASDRSWNSEIIFKDWVTQQTYQIPVVFEAGEIDRRILPLSSDQISWISHIFRFDTLYSIAALLLFTFVLGALFILFNG